MKAANNLIAADRSTRCEAARADTNSKPTAPESQSHGSLARPDGQYFFINLTALSTSAAQKEGFKPAAGAKTLPLDLFFVSSTKPATILAEYARITGHPEMPPLWSLGYQQSHRTLASREEILAEAKTFREKNLPCDAMIYLSTGFCPSGWNTANGSFVWNSSVFPDPETMIAELHKEHFRAVVHVVILSDKLSGTVQDPCDVSRFDEQKASCHWDAHRKTFAMGIDGWWPDEGDPLDIVSRLVRNRMYWDGPQSDRPNKRPYALHRNGYAGMQRYASFLWSGDVFSKWETLKNQIPIGINTGLSGVPLWGTDIGGFVPTPEFTAELFVRWFQFGAFCPLFRCHGRAWKLRLPWGWNTGDPGPIEMNDRKTVPDPGQLHDARVEPICRKYLDLRYRLLPYLYSAVRESATTGMPIMRALWMHFPDDPKAVACGDQYLWGQNTLVASRLRKRSNDAPHLSPQRCVVRLLDRRAPRRRPRNHAPSRSRNSPALRPRGLASPARPGKAIRRRASHHASLGFHLRRRRRVILALRRRRLLVQPPPRRLDGARDDLDR